MNYRINFFCKKTPLEVKNFVKNNHYLKSMSRGNKFIFVLYDGDVIKGSALFGTPVGQRVIDLHGKDTLELKRFVLKDCEKNTASWFISRCIKILSTKSIKRIITYADPEQGHEGIIYKASNFKYNGPQKYSSEMYKYKKKWHHKRAVYQNTTLGLEIRKQYKLGKITKKYMKPKHIFVYNLENRND